MEVIMHGYYFDDTDDDFAVRQTLADDHEWTARAADELADLARRYGRWFLQEAADVADALGVEDGEAGF